MRGFELIEFWWIDVFKKRDPLNLLAREEDTKKRRCIYKHSRKILKFNILPLAVMTNTVLVLVSSVAAINQVKDQGIEN